MMSDKERIRRFPVGSVFDVFQDNDRQWRKAVVSVNTTRGFKTTTYHITPEEAQKLQRSLPDRARPTIEPDERS